MFSIPPITVQSIPNARPEQAHAADPEPPVKTPTPSSPLGDLSQPNRQSASCNYRKSKQIIKKDAEEVIAQKRWEMLIRELPRQDQLPLELGLEPCSEEEKGPPIKKLLGYVKQFYPLLMEKAQPIAKEDIAICREACADIVIQILKRSETQFSNLSLENLSLFCLAWINAHKSQGLKEEALPEKVRQDTYTAIINSIVERKEQLGKLPLENVSILARILIETWTNQLENDVAMHAAAHVAIAKEVYRRKEKLPPLPQDNKDAQILRFTFNIGGVAEKSQHKNEDARALGSIVHAVHKFRRELAALPLEEFVRYAHPYFNAPANKKSGYQTMYAMLADEVVKRGKQIAGLPKEAVKVLMSIVLRLEPTEENKIYIPSLLAIAEEMVTKSPQSKASDSKAPKDVMVLCGVLTGGENLIVGCSAEEREKLLSLLQQQQLQTKVPK